MQRLEVSGAVWHIYIYIVMRKGVKTEGKATPLQVWRGSEGSRRLRLPDFNTIGT
jgi:hypothetical protein